jgi:hypothetical protein
MAGLLSSERSTNTAKERQRTGVKLASRAFPGGAKQQP